MLRIFGSIVMILLAGGCQLVRSITTIQQYTVEDGLPSNTDL